VIIGSGDIGLIMARRLTLIGCEVLAVVEIQPYPSGSVRNIVQCLNDFSIPLYLGHVVVRIEGRDRVEEVEVAPLEDGHPDSAKSFRIACDTVLLSVGLIPENELSRAAGVSLEAGTGGPWVDADLMTRVEGIFACGNVLHVHDLVDFVTEEARRCGERVVAYLRGERKQGMLMVASGANVRYVVPNTFVPGRENVLFLRPLVVKNDAQLEVRVDGQEIKARRLAHVQPSEMIRLSLGREDVSAPVDGGGGVLEVSIR
jgi:pyruvate/2-oxoglutarate dehydrogenase complex dihydrolipoamide dehydrogenase (E3) component